MKTTIQKITRTLVFPIAVAFISSGAIAESTSDKDASLYKRLGGYDAISAVVDDVVLQIAADEKLGRFWAHRGNDGIKREKQLIVDFIVAKSGGPLHYTGREMKLSHEGMRIDEEDWKILMEALNNTLSKFEVPEKESTEVREFFDSTKKDIVEET